MQDQVSDKSELLQLIDREWDALQSTIDGLNEDQLTGPTDAGGWTAKDHIAHLAAWENSMVFLLQGKARHDGLGISEPVYLAGEVDAINDAIFQNVREIPLDEVKNRLADVHQQMLALLATLSDDDLQLTYSDYLPDEPGREDGSPILNRAFGNTAHHFDLHRPDIERIANSA